MPSSAWRSFAEQRELRQVVGLDLAGVDLDRHAPDFPRRVHRDVRPAQQGLRLGPVVGGHGDPDVRGDLDRQLLHHERPVEGVEDPVGQLARERGVGVRQQQAELVAAQARHAVGVPDRVREAAGDVSDDDVGVVVAQRVGLLPELVEGDDQQGEGLSRLGHRGQLAAEAPQQPDAVRQPRDLVVVAEPAQRLLGVLLLRDVEDEAPNEARGPVGAREDPAVVAPPDHPALAVEQPVLGGEAAPELAGVAELPQHGVAVLGVQAAHPHVGLGQPLARAVAGHRQQLRAHVGAAAHLVGPRDVREGRDLLDQGAVPIARVGLAVEPAGRLHARLAVERLADPAEVPAAQAVAGPGPHEVADLVLAERPLRVDDDRRRPALRREQLEGPQRGQHVVRVPGHDEVRVGDGGDELALRRHQDERRVVAALVQVGRDLEGLGSALADHDDLHRPRHPNAPVRHPGRVRGRPAARRL
ncbi:MAG: hypothetical protein U0599_09150 [Vicinamibacteria bacterium]